MTTRAASRQRISVDELRQGRRNLLVRRQAVHAARVAEERTMRKTRKVEVTDEQIAQLMREAGAAGDLEMVAVCRWALIGGGSARIERAECARVIADARAQE